MTKPVSPDIKPVKRRASTTQPHPQVLDLRPGHIKAAAALKAREAQQRNQRQPAQPVAGTTTTSANDTQTVTVKRAPAKVVKDVSASKTQPAKPQSNKGSNRSKKTLRPDKLARQMRRRVDRTTANIVKHGKRFITSRWDHIRLARRTVVLWLGLVLLLIIGSFMQMIYYGQQDTTVAAVSGGTYAEGTTDKLTTISPLYATTDTEKAASQLIYPGLLSYDSANKLHGDLAKSWSVDQTGKVWTVTLRDGLVWSDGQPLTANDIVFTVQLMQNADISTTLASSWQSIEVAAVDDHTVSFTLSSALMSFDTALTFGVLPQHILDGKSAIEIASLFSQNPQQIVGSGPFTLDRIESTDSYDIWHFKPNQHYYGGLAQVNEFVIRTYADSQSLATGLKRGEVNAISNVSISDLNQFDKAKFKIVQLKTAGGVFALFNNSGQLTSSQTIRDALRLGLDRTAIRNAVTHANDQLDAPTSLETPIATGVYDSIDQLKQPDYNIDQAKADLDQAGWVVDTNSGYRTKDGQELKLRIVTIAGTNYEEVANLIADQWRDNLNINTQVEAVDATQAQQAYLMPRNYDVLVYQMHLGADPDMYAYWSSTQTDQTGLNLANYQSRRAEIALANGRTNVNNAARESRYVAFVNQWLQDDPAIALYQPSFIYVMDQNVNTLKSGDQIIDASYRFRNVTSWTVLTQPVMVTP